MPSLQLPPSISDVRGAALLALTERLSAPPLGVIDLTPLLIYTIDNCPDSALIFLAWQFDVLEPAWELGVKLGEDWDATDISLLTDIDTLDSPGSAAGQSDYDSWRAILKMAIPLHKFRGTPYAVKTALQSLGFASVTIQEGQNSWGGNSWPSDQGWAVCRLILHMVAGQILNPQSPAQIVAAFNFWKNARTWLDSLWIDLYPISETLAPAPRDFVRTIYSQIDFWPQVTELVAAPGWPISERKSITPQYDSRYRYSGITYGAGQPDVSDAGVVVNGVPIGQG
ncbi:MAG: phage tail protein [Candidatus Binataceae bacterium]